MLHPPSHVKRLTFLGTGILKAYRSPVVRKHISLINLAFLTLPKRRSLRMCIAKPSLRIVSYMCEASLHMDKRFPRTSKVLWTFLHIKGSVQKPHSSQQTLYSNGYTASGLLASCPGKCNRPHCADSLNTCCVSYLLRIFKGLFANY